MFFLDVQDLINYSLIDPKNVELVCGIDYYEKEEKRISSSIKDYENTVISFPYNLLVKYNYEKNITSNALIIFIDINKKALEEYSKSAKVQNNLLVEILAYEELTKVIKQRAEIIIPCNEYNVSSCVNEIKKAIKNKFKL